MAAEAAILRMRIGGLVIGWHRLVRRGGRCPLASMIRPGGPGADGAGSPDGVEIVAADPLQNGEFAAAAKAAHAMGTARRHGAALPRRQLKSLARRASF